MATLSEAQLIEYLTQFEAQPRIPPLWLGPGDDAAWMTVPQGQRLVLSIDTLIENVHFTPQITPAALGHRSLAVSLSDLAAMGADPVSVLLAITFPGAPESEWVAEFAKGFFRLARRYEVVLLGGNIARGVLSLTTSVQGIVPAPKALRRDRVVPGDLLYVTGTLGASGYAVQCMQRRAQLPDVIRNRWWMPEPRVLEGLRLRGLASAGMDLSDGLGQDLPRLLQASGVGAEIWADAIPIEPAVLAACTPEAALHHAVYGGGDYELLFSINPRRRRKLEACFQETAVPITCIGKATTGPACVLVTADKQRIPWKAEGFQHF